MIENTLKDMWYLVIWISGMFTHVTNTDWAPFSLYLTHMSDSTEQEAKHHLRFGEFYSMTTVAVSKSKCLYYFNESQVRPSGFRQWCLQALDFSAASLFWKPQLLQVATSVKPLPFTYLVGLIICMSWIHMKSGCALRCVSVCCRAVNSSKHTSDYCNDDKCPSPHFTLSSLYLWQTSDTQTDRRWSSEDSYIIITLDSLTSYF